MMNDSGEPAPQCLKRENNLTSMMEVCLVAKDRLALDYLGLLDGEHQWAGALSAKSLGKEPLIFSIYHSRGLFLKVMP